MLFSNVLKWTLVFASLVIFYDANAQQSQTDSLKRILNNKIQDTLGVKVLGSLSRNYQSNQPDTSLQLAKEQLFLSNRLEFESGQLEAMQNMADAYLELLQYDSAANYYYKAFQLVDQQKDHKRFTSIMIGAGMVLWRRGNLDSAMNHYTYLESLTLDSAQLASIYMMKANILGNLSQDHFPDLSLQSI